LFASKIKIPKRRNIKKTVERYNLSKGRGIEIFYDLKSGKLILADYYRSYNRVGYRKISTVSGNEYMTEISEEFIRQEVARLIEEEKIARQQAKAENKERLRRYRIRRRNYYLKKFGLKK
jgi:ribosomal protein L19E